ncbi:cytochrome P450 [Streptomyces sp. IB201691-2A2]|uniref:cytochrome P450 n=1 Tax=Streptomyces sp. IB201691-2A2 TaxID=2561920 RepID=UPI00117C005F|nr:cytochrome P450 [Streptomyces sp. IB201691-2A2]TRO59612.1 cytochrome P450 [Streptomyces sp. IB201691-2A2]
MDGEPHSRLDELQRDPYPHYERARRAKGLTFIPELDAWLAARDEDVREILRRPDDFSSANALRPDVMPAPPSSRFDITRTPGRHLAFGLGVHTCPGSQLAREQLRLTLEQLTTRFPTLRLTDDHPVTMRPTLIHRSPENLHITW